MIKSTPSSRRTKVRSAKPVLEMQPWITAVPTVETAKALPIGSVVGDKHGGLTFTDAVAAVLESRSTGGWSEVLVGEQRWTVIVLNR